MSKYQNLYQTVKKSKNSCLAHARSYDDLLQTQLEPQQIKILLNNDQSLKKIVKHKMETYELPLSHQTTHHKSNQINHCNDNQIHTLLQNSIRKQQLLMKKNLFDPYKYFGSSSHINSIQQSTRHHQSRLDAMMSYSDYNSPTQTEENSSINKSCKKQNNNVKKHQTIKINISTKNSLSSKNDPNLKQKNCKNLQNVKRELTKIDIGSLSDRSQFQSKKNNLIKACIYSPQRVIVHKKSNQFKYSQKQNEAFSIKKSIGQSISTYRVGVGKSPKNYVKQNKQNYLKMNINSIQKVRLKLKLSKA